jgi:hypothetical protein
MAAPRGAPITPHPTLLPPGPPPGANGSQGPPRRGPVFPVGRVRKSSSPPGPRAIPTLRPSMAAPAPPPAQGGGVPVATMQGEQARSASAVIPPPMAPAPSDTSGPSESGDGARFLPPPLPPEWSEALGLARAATKTAPALDRRASAALEPPPVERRNAVALSLAGLFDDLGVPAGIIAEVPEEANREPRSRRDNPAPWVFDDTDDPKPETTTPRRRRTGLRGLASPGGLIALAAVAAALYVVGYFVARNDAPKPPNSNQVTTVTQAR